MHEIVELTQQLLDSIVSGDWETYQSLCDESLTCFEPAASGNLIQGPGFHKFYFDNRPENVSSKSNTTISSPHVRLIGEDVAVISLIRVVQKLELAQNEHSTQHFEETRIWQKIDGKWKHIHFHRSHPGRPS